MLLNERSSTAGRVTVTGSAARERATTGCRVGSAAGVARKRVSTSDCIAVAGVGAPRGELSFGRHSFLPKILDTVAKKV